MEDGAEIEEFDIDSHFKIIENITVFEDRVIIGMLDVTEIEFGASWDKRRSPDRLFCLFNMEGFGNI